MSIEYAKKIIEDLGWFGVTSLPPDFGSTLYFLANMRSKVDGKVFIKYYMLNESFAEIAKSVDMTEQEVEKCIRDMMTDMRERYNNVIRLGLDKYCDNMPTSYRSGDFNEGYLKALADVKSMFEQDRLINESSNKAGDKIAVTCDVYAMELLDGFSIKKASEVTACKNKCTIA